MRKKREPAFLKRLREKQKHQLVVRKSWLHRFADWLDGWHITRIFQAFGSFLLVIVILGYVEEREQRIIDRQLAAEEREQRIVVQ